MSEAEKSRRLARLYVTPELIASMVRVPESAQVRGAHWDPECWALVLMVEDPSFDEALPGCTVPRIEGRFTRNDDLTITVDYKVESYAGR